MEIDGVEYKMMDMNLPTVDPENPYELTEDEMEVMMRLKSSFRHCEKLQRHARFLLKNGSLLRKYVFDKKIYCVKNQVQSSI